MSNSSTQVMNTAKGNAREAGKIVGPQIELKRKLKRGTPRGDWIGTIKKKLLLCKAPAERRYFIVVIFKRKIKHEKTEKRRKCRGAWEARNAEERWEKCGMNNWWLEEPRGGSVPFRNTPSPPKHEDIPKVK